MELFTIKDFIAYNNPCFSCHHPISISIGIFNLNEIIYRRPFINSQVIEIILQTTYTDHLLLWIDPITSHFTTNNKEQLSYFLSSRQLFLSSACECGTIIESNEMVVDLAHNRVLPVSLSSETLVVVEGKKTFLIQSCFKRKGSLLHIYQSFAKVKEDIKVQLSLLPRSYFKSRAHFLERMRFYITYC